MKTKNVIITFLLLLLSITAIASESREVGNIQICIYPPKSDGGMPLRYYQVEYRIYARWSMLWSIYGKFIVHTNPYKPETFKLASLETGYQYEIRVIGINDLGKGSPGDVTLSPTVKKDYIVETNVHCGEDMPSRPPHKIATFNLNFTGLNSNPSIQIPYRTKK